MKRRNRTLRVVLVAAVLILALGATQAAVIPQAKETTTQSARTGQRMHFHGYLAGVLNFFRLGQWATLAPVPPLFVPPKPALLGSTQDAYEKTAKPITDDQNPV